MITPNGLKATIQLLTAAGLGNAPQDGQAVASWSFLVQDLLDDWNDERLRLAVRGHLRDPKQGAFWPRPADLVRNDVDPDPTPEQLDAEAWDRAVLAITRRGSRLRDELWAFHLKALADIGGAYAIRSADSKGLTNLRFRFLDRCKTEREAKARGEVAAPALRLLTADPALAQIDTWEAEANASADIPIPTPSWLRGDTC